MADLHEEMQESSGNRPQSDAMGTQPEAEPDRQAMPVDDEQPPRLAFPVVGVGASAGGLEAFSEFISAMRPDSGMAFVLILHLPPDRPSMLAEILSRRTKMTVKQVEHGQSVEPDHVYVIRPGHVLTIEDGTFRLGPELGGPRAANRPVDDFFKSLAQEQRERAICIIMSGMGSNGSAGAQAIKAVGGLCVSQDPESCQYPSMPRHLIDQGYADNILRPGDMPDVLLAYAGHPYAKGGREEDAEPSLRRNQNHMREILAILRTRTRQDFSGYKKPTVLRRIQRRMGLTRLVKMGDYAKLLRQSATEVSGLAEDLLIHVTGFFRDPAAWEVLRERVIVPLIAAREQDAEVRAWVTACSSGEEAYTLAILLTEEADRVGKRLDIKVFATDMAERTLAQARAGLFPGGIEAEITPERLARFFERDDAVYRVRQELRERVVFAPQNVLQDPPFSRLDIATCRNLLIYLEPELQKRVLSLLHFGLREGGALFLGTSETVGGSEDMFEAIDKPSRIFRRIGQTRHGQVDFPLPPAFRAAGITRRVEAGEETSADRKRGKPRESVAQRTNRTLIEQHTPAAVTIDRDYRIIHYHGNTHDYFQQPSGEPSRDLLLLARDGLRGAVRNALNRAAADNAKATTFDGWVEVEPGRRVRLVITATPLVGSTEKESGGTDYFVISFERREEVPAISTGGKTGSNPELSGELRRVRDELQSTVEELQTSNEELKASHEEVVSINEELQSSNEELETSREEMQSLNEELTTVNAQLRAKVEEQQAASSDLSSLLTSTDIAVLFLDPKFRIRRFTPPVRSLLDLIATDVGRPVSALARKFEDPLLLSEAETVLERLVPVEREVSAEGGRWFLRRITPYRTADNRIDGVVVTFVEITARRLAEEAVRASEEQFRRSIEDAPIPVIMQADDGQVLQVSKTWTELTGYTLADIPNADAWLTRAYGPGADEVRTHMHDLFDGTRKTLNVEFAIHTRSGDNRHWSFSASAPGKLKDGRRFMVGMAVDITDRREAEKSMLASEERYSALFNAIDQGFCTVEVKFDERSRPLDYRFLEVSPSFEGHTGITNGVGRWMREIAPDQEEQWFESYGRVALTGKPERFEAFSKPFGRWWSVFAFRVGDPSLCHVAVLFDDITERKQMDADLAAVADRAAYLVELSDTLRPLADPIEIELAATRVLGERLKADRAFYCEIESDEGHVVIHREYKSDGTAGITGRFKLSDLGGYWSEGYRSGRTLVTPDVHKVKGTQPPAITAVGVQACVGVPVKKNDKLRGILIVHSATVRDWTPAEVALVESTAERTWAAIERARSEEALGEAQERLRLALFAARMGTWSWETDNNRHTRDENLNRLLGLEPVKTTVPIEEFFSHIHPDDVPAVRAAFGVSASDGRPLHTEFRVLWPDGTVRWLLDQGEVFPKHGAPYMAGACIDVTERREAETALRESEERFRLAVEAAHMGFWDWDVTSGGVKWEPVHNRLLGLPEDQSQGTAEEFFARIHPDDLSTVQKRLSDAVRNGTDFKAEFRATHIDGSTRWVAGYGRGTADSGGKIVRMIGGVLDITERKLAEQTIRDSEERLRLVVEGARDFAMLLLDSNGRIAAWNPGAERLLGFSESDAVGQDVAIIFTPEDRAAGAPQEELGKAAATGRAEDERWHIRKGEGRFWASGVMTAIRHPDGSLRGFAKILRDDTLRRKAEDSLLKSIEAAESANRTKDDFIATLSHELRTPLSAILIWSNLLQGNPDVLASSELQEAVEAIASSADSQKELIEDLLDISRITSGNLRIQSREIDLVPVLRDALDAIAPAAEAKAITVNAELSPEIGIVRADPDRIRQIFWNLLTNAVKFTPKGGRVTITSGRDGDEVFINVKDTGQGLTPDFLPHVFGRFRQADPTNTRRHGGLGLGLAIVKQLVELHGGTISVESAGRGRGASFTARFPFDKLKKRASLRRAKVAADEHAFTFDGVSLLLVEDDDNTRKAISSLLESVGFEVRQVASASAALTAFAERRPDLILSDIGLPGQNGYDLIRHIRQEEAASGLPPTPAVAVTAYARETDRMMALEAGFHRHVGKPIEPRQLLDILSELRKR